MVSDPEPVPPQVPLPCAAGRACYETASACDTRPPPPWDDLPASDQQMWHDLAAAKRRQEAYEQAHGVGCPDHPEGSTGMIWQVQLEGDPAFPGNAARACRLAAKGRSDSLREALMRVAEALDRATPIPDTAHDGSCCMNGIPPTAGPHPDCPGKAGLS